MVKVGKADREVLESWLCARTTPHELALRAHILLAGADGESVRATAERLRVATNTVTLWRRRYRAEGLAGIRTRARSGLWCPLGFRTAQAANFSRYSTGVR